MPVDGLLSDVLEQIPEPGAFLEGRTGYNSLYEMPTLITKKVVSDCWL